MTLISDPLGLATGPLGITRAAHLLRRATFGPSKKEIEYFATLTADQAVDELVSNVTNLPGSGLNAPPPCILELNGNELSIQAAHPGTFRAVGQPFVDHDCAGATANDTSCKFDPSFNGRYVQFIQSWWIERMMEMKVVNGVPKPCILEKMTLFWQNHFVVAHPAVEDYRYTWRYLKLLRNGNLENPKGALGNFKRMVIDVTKDPAMLEYLSGSSNIKGNPNENYARELQELFTVGLKTFDDIPNYQESDVIAAAKVLSGWRSKSYRGGTPADVGSEFVSGNHEEGSKVFSSKYGNQTIASGTGDQELNSLVDMLLNHDACPKFICRKLYRWFVSPVVDSKVDIEFQGQLETQVINVLADIFKDGNFEIEPVIKKLLKSRIFYDDSNIGSMIKSPMDMVIGTYRYFEIDLPDLATKQVGHFALDGYIRKNTRLMGMELLQQPSVFGFPAYYQNGYTRNWITGESLGRQKEFVDGGYYIPPSGDPIKAPGIVEQTYNSNSNEFYYDIKLDDKVKALQPNFSTNITPENTLKCDQLLNGLMMCAPSTGPDIKKMALFARDLSPAQVDYLIDDIMMDHFDRKTYWEDKWMDYRIAPTSAKLDVLNAYYNRLVNYLLQMPEYFIF